MGGNGKGSTSGNKEERKRLNKPSMVARTLQDIQKEVEVLTQRRQELASSAALYSVQAKQFGINGEILVQISTLRSEVTIIPISEVIKEVEQEDGLFITDVSSSQSFTGRLIHYLHLQVEENHEISCETLQEKILNLCQNWEIDPI